MLDGFPRDSEQAAAFEADIGAPVNIIYLEVNDIVLKERLMERNNFDDTEESIANRIASFASKTLPLIEKYGGKVAKINAERSKEEVFADIQKVMEGI